MREHESCFWSGRTKTGPRRRNCNTKAVLGVDGPKPGLGGGSVTIVWMAGEEFLLSVHWKEFLRRHCRGGNFAEAISWGNYCGGIFGFGGGIFAEWSRFVCYGRGCFVCHGGEKSETVRIFSEIAEVRRHRGANFRPTTSWSEFLVAKDAVRR